jgi:hypothetical protein
VATMVENVYGDVDVLRQHHNVAVCEVARYGATPEEWAILQPHCHLEQEYALMWAAAIERGIALVDTSEEAGQQCAAWLANVVEFLRGERRRLGV